MTTSVNTDWMSYISPGSRQEAGLLHFKKTSMHPLQEVDCGKVDKSVARLAVIADSHLPVQRRNASALNRKDVRAEVLQVYSTNVPIQSFVTTGDDESQKVTDEERAKMRAERLNTPLGIQNNQAALIRVVEALDADLKSLWSRGEKVKSIRVAIQATKLLAAPKVPQCYPSVFVLVATVLDTFGNFVSERLQTSAAGKSFVVATLLKRGQDASSDLIPPETVEMCNNWFIKIASIRELLPRIYIELSLLKCYKFVTKKIRVNFVETVKRLGRQIRGIADPLVAAHMRWYLFMRAGEVLKAPEWASILEQCCLDTFATLEQLSGPALERLWLERDCTKEQYLSLFVPALQWQLDTIARFGCKATEPAFIKTVLEHATKIFNSSALILPILRSFSPRNLIQHSVDTLLYHIDECVTSPHVTRLKLISSLALILAEHRDELPFPRARRTALLNEMWGRVETESSSSSDVNEFLETCGALMQYCAVHMGAKQVNLLLSTVRKRVEAAGEDTRRAVFRMLSGLVCSFDLDALLASAHFLPLLRHVDPSSRKQLARAILQLTPEDPQYAAVVLELSRILSDLITEYSVDDAYECAGIICQALRAVASSDPERQLEFMCETRHSLPMLDEVKIALVNEALKFVHRFGRQAKRRNAAKAFLAFCHVTIPAATNVFTRVQLAVTSASVALLYGFVAQGEALLRLALSFLQDATPLTVLPDGTVVSNDTKLKDIVGSLVAIGAATPSHAKHGHLYVINSVLTWNDGFAWSNSSTGKLGTYSAVLRTLSRALQGETALAFPRCMTENYIKDQEFIVAAQELLNRAGLSAAAWVREQLQTPSQSMDALCNGALELFQTAALFGDSASLCVCECSTESWQVLAKYASGSSGNANVEVTRAMSVLPYVIDRLKKTGEFPLLTDYHAARATRKRVQQQEQEAGAGDEGGGASHVDPSERVEL
jgi:hypothetical protein